MAVPNPMRHWPVFLSMRAFTGETHSTRPKPILMRPAAGEARHRRRYEHVLASLCVTAWQQKTETGDRFLSDEDLRTVLVYCSIVMRTHMLWHVSHWPTADKLTLLKEV